MRRVRRSMWRLELLQAAPVRVERGAVVLILLIGPTGPLPQAGRRRSMPDWRDPMPRTPGPMPPRWSGSGPTCRRCAGAWAGKVGGLGWVRQAHAASISSAPQAVGCGRVVLEDIFAMVSAERFQMLSLARSPRNPQDRWPSIGSLAVLGHPCYSPFLVLPVSKHWREDPDPVPAEELRHKAPPARGLPSTAAQCTSSAHASALCRRSTRRFPPARK